MTLPIQTNDPTVPQGIEPDPTPVSTEEIATAINLLDASAEHLTDGDAVKGWTAKWQDGIETFTRPDGRQYVRARSSEDADVIVSFPQTRGLTDLRLIERGESANVRRAEKKKRREERELRKRGYDV